MHRYVTLFCILCLLLAATPARAQSPVAPDVWSVARFLAQQPGPLKDVTVDDKSAAQIIEEQSLAFGVSPFLTLALLEATAGLLSNPTPPADALDYPFGRHGPAGFAEQITWVNRELRAGLGPYQQPPTLRFPDGITVTIALSEPAEWIAIKRFLAQGRDSVAWLAAVKATMAAIRTYFDGQLAPPAAAPASVTGWLRAPWPLGTRVVHLAYFDHMYPMVDLGGDGNSEMIDYLGRRNVQYNSHDGHDYAFPDAPFATPILAAAAGTAYAFSESRGLGVVIVHPNGYETVYWHLGALDPIFQTDGGVAVAAGQQIGISGASGVSGTPHLHFEVRRWEGGIRKQVDPYGWYGPGPDPCPAYAGCAVSSWLWHPDLIGMDVFTPPDDASPPADTTPPIGTLRVAPPEDLLFAVTFDNHPLQTVGQGLPIISGTLRFAEGRFAQALIGDSAELAFPTNGNLTLEQGTISLWAKLPEQYPGNSLDRHYLFATSADPAGAPIYTGTLALRRDRLGPNASAQWTFWTVGDAVSGGDLLSVPDTLAPGWHHFAVRWDAATGMKALFIDGAVVAETTTTALPALPGAQLHLGRFASGGAPAGMRFDELAIFARPLSAREIAELAANPPLAPDPVVVTDRVIRIDTNAMDDGGGIVAVIAGMNGELSDPLPYYESYRWSLPPIEGERVVEVHYLDRAGNTTVVSQTVMLNLPPRASIQTRWPDPYQVHLLITATDRHEPIEMQFSAAPDDADAPWLPLVPELYWRWDETEQRRLFIRFRDSAGQISEPLAIDALANAVFVPLVTR